jgi:hypothetical protein
MEEAKEFIRPLRLRSLAAAHGAKAAVVAFSERLFSQSASQITPRLDHPIIAPAPSIFPANSVG